MNDLKNKLGHLSTRKYIAPKNKVKNIYAVFVDQNILHIEKLVTVLKGVYQNM